MPAPTVKAVAPGSAAHRAGLQPGDQLLALNGEVPRDVIRYRLLTDAAELELDVLRGGLEQQVSVAKRDGEPLGAEVDAAIFDQVRTCDNHCPFCFIYQLPTGMRKSLYLKDDDYRLSFLYGNFTTLTRFTELDLERVVDEGLGPLYVSIHTTDPDLRSAMLRNRRGATSLRWLSALLDHGVEVHGQVVVCPGVNDAAALDATLLGVLDRFPGLASVCVVPLGVSRYNREATMRVHTQEEAVATVATVERWQERYLDALGRRMAFAADEYYLMAGRPFPDAATYEGFPQHENGVGMVRTFEAEVRAALAGDQLEGQGPRSGFFAWVDGAPAEGYRAPRMDLPCVDAAREPATNAALRTTHIVTGEYGAEALRPLLDELREVAPGDLELLPVANEFFGGNIAVTGLLVGADLRAALAAAPEGDRYLVPDVALSRGCFLDGMTPADLPRAVEIVPTTGPALVAAVRV